MRLVTNKGQLIGPSFWHSTQLKGKSWKKQSFEPCKYCAILFTPLHKYYIGQKCLAQLLHTHCAANSSLNFWFKITKVQLICFKLIWGRNKNFYLNLDLTNNMADKFFSFTERMQRKCVMHLSTYYEVYGIKLRFQPRK